ncbi:hypothetical protein [Deinococcus hopiensis]|nr:hypothetical protein [Deinococcus hopiensis]
MTGRLLRAHLLGLLPDEVMRARHPQDTVYPARGGGLSALPNLIDRP